MYDLKDFLLKALDNVSESMQTLSIRSVFGHPEHIILFHQKQNLFTQIYQLRNAYRQFIHRKNPIR